MASMGVTQNDVDILVRKIKAGGMLNRTLQAICSNEGLKQTGVKTELQQRIIDSMLFSSGRALLATIHSIYFEAV
jgi:hypothetical protein